MQLRKLYRTIETIASRSAESEEDLLKQIIEEIIKSEEAHLKGGRIWKFDTKTGSYILLHQSGVMEPIRKGYAIKLKDYPIFFELPKLRTVLGNEQDQYLRKRGILNYSATGVGEKVKWRTHTLYRYVLAFNADHLNDSVTSTLNIISSALTSVLRAKKVERKAQVLERDLDKARDIQQSILPQHEMRFNRTKCTAYRYRTVLSAAIFLIPHFRRRPGTDRRRHRRRGKQRIFRRGAGIVYFRRNPHGIRLSDKNQLSSFPGQ